MTKKKNSLGPSVFTISYCLAVCIRFRYHSFCCRKYNFDAIKKNVIITWPKTFLFWTGIIFLHVYVFLCLTVFISIISKSYDPSSMKFCRMIYYDKKHILLEDGLNQLSKAYTSPIWNFKNVISYKVSDRFLWNLAGWCIIITVAFLI